MVKRSAPSGEYSSKKQKTTSSSSVGDAPAKKEDAGPRTVFTSSLVADEVDFPRGGGTSLTQLEAKQVRDEGRAEAEKEIRDGQARRERTVARKSERTVRKEKSEKLKLERAERDKDNIRVEHLNYKRLLPGTRLLSRVHSILQYHLILSLPNQLLAHVPVTEISDRLTERLTKAESDSDMSGDENSDDEEDDTPPELWQMFKPGQYLTAVVNQTFHPPTTLNESFTRLYPPTEVNRLAARCEVTLNPAKVNDGVAIVDLDKGFRISGSVKSEEDHGWIIDLGIKGVEGFLPKKEGATYEEGQLVEAVIKEKASNGKVVQLSVEPEDVAKSTVSEVSNVSSLLPGHLVSALVTAVVPSGLNLKVCGFFDGTVDLVHLTIPDGQDIDMKYKIGKKVRARVIYDNLATSPKRFGLSLLPHIIELTSPQVVGGEGALEEQLHIGTIVDDVKITRIEKEWGLVCKTPEGYDAFVSVYHVADERPPTLSGSSGPWKPNTSHKARVIGHSPFDGIVLLSMAPKVLAQRFMLVDEVKIGEVVRGTIRKLGEKQLFVDIAGSVDGIVFPHHYADIMLKHPEKRFRPGQTIKCRVFAVESAKNRVKLTLKKSLVESKDDIPSSFDDLRAEMETAGVVRKVFEKGCLVELFGDSVVYIPLSEVSDAFVKDINDAVFVGKPVTVRITSVDRDTEKAFGSIRQAMASHAESKIIEVGDTVEGTIKVVKQDQIVLSIPSSRSVALLSLSNLAHHRGSTISELRTSLKIGETIPDLEVVVKNPDSGLLIVSNKGQTQHRRLGDLDISTLKPGQIVPAQVAKKDHRGYQVRIAKGVHGQMSLTDMVDDYSQLSESLPSKEYIKACVLNVDTGNRQVDLSMRPSRLNAPGSSSKTAVVDPEINSLEDIKEGQTIRGFVKNVTAAGVFVTLGRTVTARVMIKELFDDFVAEWQPHFRNGQLVEGKIIKIDKKKSQVEMSFRKKAKSSKGKKDVQKLGLADFSVDQKVDTVVRKVEAYGLFLRIDGTMVSGLCHRSEVSDDPNADVAAALARFREGDKLKAKIITIDADSNKISFGIKPSYFATADFVAMDDAMEEDEAEADGSSEAAEDDAVEHNSEADMLMLESEDEKDEDAENDDADEDEVQDDEMEDVDDAQSEAEEEIVFSPAAPSVAGSKDKVGKKANLAGLSAGFDWEGAQDTPGSDSDDESDSEDEAEAAPTKSAQPRTKATSTTEDRTADVALKQPESTADFERALLASPNSSYLWVQFMSFQLELNEIAKAKEIGRRALKVIAHREEEEKLNVWMALLNLENAHGTAESLDKLFKEAVQYNDGLTVHLRMAKVLTQTDKYEAAENIYKRACKKFGDNGDVWTAFAEYYFARDNAEEARALLPRSLKSLPKAAHANMIEKFAILEFRMGDAERGKTIYEGLIDKFPKKLNIWSTYIDQVGKQGDIQGVRGLVDRALDLKLNAHRAKFLFKKLLALEARIGDEEGEERAKEKAREWVISNTSAGGEDESDE